MVFVCIVVCDLERGGQAVLCSDGVCSTLSAADDFYFGDIAVLKARGSASIKLDSAVKHDCELSRITRLEFFLERGRRLTFHGTAR